MKCVMVCLVALVYFFRSACAAETQPSPVTNAKDGSVLISIPAGEFTMGSDEPEEKPVHKIYLDEYKIGKYEVTVAQYRKFCKEKGRKMPRAATYGSETILWKDNHPIVNVTWKDASDYAKWAGARLPTEAEWEKAARGTDGRKYPWGDEWDETKCAVNINGTQPVGCLPAGMSPYGCMDMAGNVWEWCADWYGPNYYRTSPSRNPKGPAKGTNHIMRGGSFADYEGFLTTTTRGDPSAEAYCGYIGFRIAK